MTDFLLQMRPYFGEEEKKLILKYMDSDGFYTEYINTTEFEKQLSQVLNCKHCFAVNNGTVALTVAALAIGVKPDDEVIVPNYTMIAGPNSIQILGAKPVLCDVEYPSLCLDKSLVMDLISPKTKAVMLMSANGRYPSYCVDEFRKELNSRGIFLIDDSAQSLGSCYPDYTAIGKKANLATLSFSAPKIISTGQGGLVFTDDDQIAAKIKKLKDFGREGGGNDLHNDIGYNFKFTELQAIVGLAQLTKLKKRKHRRIEQTTLYRSLLSKSSAIEQLYSDTEYNVPWFNEVLVQNRDEIILKLNNENIGSRPMYPPINKQLAYQVDGNFPVSEKIGKQGLWLPSHMGVTNEHIEKICGIIINNAK